MRKIFVSIFQNKKCLLLLVGGGLILSLIPIHPANAFLKELGEIVDAILSLPVNLAINTALALALFILVIIFNLFSGLLASAFALVVALTKWLIDTSLNITVIPNAANTPQIVADGWSFTLGFINMLFVLILVFYGLSTILRIREYDLRKHLAKVLMIAVLVNFTPVIVGLVVDAGNITTSFFMQKALETDIINIVLGDEAAKTGVWGRVIKPAIDNAISTILSDLFGDPSKTIGLFIEAVGPLFVAIIFLIAASLIFLMVSFVFLMRIVMLWVLMILAPIAFFSYVIPRDAPLTMLFPDILLWRKWWEEFLRWVIVGIPFGLFIYISSWMIKNSDDILLAGDTYKPSGLTFTIGGITLDIATLFEAILTTVPFIVPLAVLYVGYKISMKAAPAGAVGIMKGVTGAVKTAGALALTAGAAAAGATVGGAMAGSAAAGVKGVSSGLQKAEEKLGERRITKPFKYALKPLTGAARGAERVLVPRLRKAEAGMKKEKIPEGFKDMKGEAQKDVQMSRLTAGNRLATAAQMKTPDLAKFAASDERFRGKLAQDVKNKAGDTDYSEYINKIKKAIPDIVDEEILINLEPDKVKKGKLIKAIDEEVEEMDKTIDKKDIVIEAGLKYKVITQNEVDADEGAALAKVQDKLSEGNINQFKRDAAAGAITVGKANPAAVGEYSDTTLKSFAVRRGSQRWHGGHLAKVREKHDKDTIEDFFEKPGGINTIGINELEEKNSRLAQHLVVHPTGREWNYKGRKEVMEMEGGKYKTEDQYGRIRPNYEKYKAEREKRKEVRGSAEIMDEIAGYKKQLKTLEDSKEEYDRREAPFPEEKRLERIKKTAIPTLEIELEKVKREEEKIPEEIRKPVPPPVTTPEELTKRKMVTGKKALQEWRDLKKEEREIISDIKTKIKSLGDSNESIKTLEKELASLEEDLPKAADETEAKEISSNIGAKQNELEKEKGNFKGLDAGIKERRGGLEKTQARIKELQEQETQARLEKSKVLTPEAQIQLEREGVTGEELEKRKKELILEDVDLARRLAKPEKGAPKWVKESREKANQYISDIKKDRKPLQKLNVEIEKIDEKLTPLSEKTVLTEKDKRDKERLTKEKNEKVSERDIIFDKVRQRKEALRGIRGDIKTWMEKKDVFLAPLIDEEDRKRKASEKRIDYDAADEKTKKGIEEELVKEMKELITPLRIKKKDLAPEVVGPVKERSKLISGLKKDLTSLNNFEKEIDSLDKKIKFRKTALETEKASVPEERRREWEREKRKTTGLDKLEGKFEATQNKKRETRERIKSSKEELIKIGETIKQRQAMAEPEPGWDGPKPDWVVFDEEKELDPMIYKISEERRERGDTEFKPMEDRAEAIERLTKELVEKPSSLPKLPRRKKVKGKIPKAFKKDKEILEDKTTGDKLILSINRKMKTLKELNRRINKNKNQLIFLEEQIEKATEKKARDTFRKRWGPRQKMLNDRIKQAQMVQKEITDEKKELENVRKNIELRITEEEAGRRA